jgi:hypothetical protein
VFALEAFGAQLVVGGSFNTAGGLAAQNLAAWDGISWNTAIGFANDVVYALQEYSGALYAGGDFTMMDGSPASHVAHTTPTSWAGAGLGTNGRVTCFSPYTAGGVLVAGGFFTQADGAPADRVAAWNGTSWSALGSGMDNDVSSLTEFNGELVAGGVFTTAGGAPASRMARWDGSAWRNLGSGTNNPVSALLADGNFLRVGGWFTEAGGRAQFFLATWADSVITLDITVPTPLMAVKLSRATPNPFRRRVVFSWSIEEPGNVRISVYDVAGRRIAVVLEGGHAAGPHVTSWNGVLDGGRGAAPGVYLAVLETAGHRVSKRFVRIE